MTELLVPFQYEYLLKAMGASALIGGVCGLLSCFVILKRWSLIGDALSHAVVPGVAIAFYLGAPMAVGAFISGMLATLGMGFVRIKTKLKEDAIIGLVFTTFFALGLLLISMYPSEVSLRTIVFGNILGISDFDMLQVIAIAAVTLFTMVFIWKDLALYCFDENHAIAIGIKTKRLYLILLTLLSATAIASLQTVGACLVVATLVTPGATAYLLTDRFGRMIIISMAIGVSTGIVGTYWSYFLDGSTGGCIVVLQTMLFFMAFFFAPKHGFLKARQHTQVKGGFQNEPA